MSEGIDNLESSSCLHSTLTPAPHFAFPTHMCTRAHTRTQTHTHAHSRTHSQASSESTTLSTMPSEVCPFFCLSIASHPLLSVHRDTGSAHHDNLWLRASRGSKCSSHQWLKCHYCPHYLIKLCRPVRAEGPCWASL